MRKITYGTFAISLLVGGGCAPVGGGNATAQREDPAAAERREAAIAEQRRQSVREAQRQLVLSELREAETGRDRAAERVTGREMAVAAWERRISERESALEQYKGKVKEYMMNHKMILAGIAAAGVGGAMALSSGNEFSEDAKAIGGIGGILAAAYVLANASEATEVVDQLNQASSNVNVIERQIADMRQSMESETSQLTAERSVLDNSSAGVAALRAKLAALTES